MAAVVPDVAGAGRALPSQNSAWESWTGSPGGSYTASTTPDETMPRQPGKHRAFRVTTASALDVLRIDGLDYAATDTTRNDFEPTFSVAWQGATATDKANAYLGTGSSANEVSIVSAGAGINGWVHVFYSRGL